MATIPILLDVRPRYLGEAPTDSLLLLPAGAGTLLGEVRAAAAAVTQQRALVLPLFGQGAAAHAAYAEAVRAAAGDAPVEVITPASFRDPLARFEPSDQLLIIAPGCYPAAGLDLRKLVGARVEDARMLRHLLAFESTTLRTKEFVQPGSDGRLRRIQRYFEPVTWPFPAGVIASLVPVACVLTGPDAPWGSLAELRTAMAARGVPSHDIPCHDAFFHLDDEAGALALGEQRAAALAGASDPRRAAGAPTVVLGRESRVHPTARLLGPVVVGDGAVVGADALIVGPAMIGPGARVGDGAAVAQCLVTAGAEVAAGATVRHRVVAQVPNGVAPGAAGGAPSAGAQRRHAPAVAAAAPTAEAPRASRTRDVMERAVALALLVLAMPVIAVAGALVALTSPGPVFYGDPREGRDGRPFRCWKLRSMRPDAASLQRALAGEQQLDGPQFKMDDDPRVTPVGRWLRRLNIDELPQLWNVIRGEMSLVGPRPSPFRENQICIPWRHGRLSVRPGITGLWQVCRHDRASGDFHQWIYYDLLYVRHASLMVDLRILVGTFVSIATRRPVRLEAVIPAVDPAALGEARRVAADAPAVRPSPPTRRTPLPRTATPHRPARALRARRPHPWSGRGPDR